MSGRVKAKRTNRRLLAVACVGLGGSGDTKIRMMTALQDEVSNSFSRIA